MNMVKSLAAMSGLVALLGAGQQPRHQLTFEDRVNAQAAIERVYYSHQIGVRRPFEQAVPRELLLKKVRASMEHSAALERYWRTPITAPALRGELERIVAETRFPERLREIFSALGDDPVRIGECFVRPILAERLARNFFASDERIHAEAMQAAKTLRNDLLAGHVRADQEHPLRKVLEIRELRPERAAETTPQGAVRPRAHELTPEEYASQRSRWPDRVGQIGPVQETRTEFGIAVLLDEAGGTARAAEFSVRKQSWRAWWESAPADLRAMRGEQLDIVTDPDLLAPSLRPRPASGVAISAPHGALDPPCAPYNVWDNGKLDALPPGTYGHTAVWTGDEMIVWGGFAVNELTQTGSRYNPLTDTWTPTTLTQAPEARAYHTAVWTGSVMVVWGGSDAQFTQLASGGRYDPLTDTWSPTSLDNVPIPGTSGTSTVWTGDVMIVWGGNDDAGLQYLNSGGVYDPVADTWTATTLAQAPEPRAYHTAVWTGTEMMVWGGYADRDVNTGARYDPSADRWTEITLEGAPAPRNAHAAVWTGSVMVAWGGANEQGEHMVAGGRYDPVADSWSPTSLIDAPEGRREFTAVWTGSRMIVWGGATNFNDLSTGGLYDPLLDSWTQTSTLNAPYPRTGNVAVWTGGLMIVWGAGGAWEISPGGRYDPETDSWTPTSLGYGPRTTGAVVWTGNEMLVWGTSSGLGARYDPLVDLWTPMSTAGAPEANSGGKRGVWTGDLLIVWGGDSLGTGGRYDPVADTWAPTSTEFAPTPRLDHTMSGRAIA